MLEDFFLRSLAATFGIAIVAGPLGCFIVWRRMAYFGDSLAHSALLGVALGLLLGFDPSLGTLAAAVTFAALLFLLERQKRVARDTLLGILSHGGLSLGLVALAFVTGTRVDLMSYLFGEVLAIGTDDLIWIYGSAGLALATLIVIWRQLLIITVHEDLARAEGVPVARVNFLYLMAVALTVAVAMKVVGVLLITALLIIPPAAARQFAKSPEMMALIAILVGALAGVFGLLGSITWDTPAGPSIVLAALALLLISLAVRPILSGRG